MAKVVLKDKESIDDAIRRWKREVNKAGTLKQVRAKQFYVKPSEDRKMKIKANKKNKNR